jgi:DNA-binding ferritin-like protein
MNEAQIADELNELVRQCGGTSNSTSKRVAVLANQAQDNQKALQKVADCLRESLDYLRVCIKYMLLDIEATRRENEYLRKLLQDNEPEE